MGKGDYATGHAVLEKNPHLNLISIAKDGLADSGRDLALPTNRIILCSRETERSLGFATIAF
jgi:hypothetical protein